MKKILIMTLCVWGMQGMLAQNKDFSIEHVYPIEASHSYVNFVATYMGYAEVRGDFSTFNGTLYYNPEDPSQTSVSLRIDVSSIDSNNDWRDKDLKSDQWFDAESYPYIYFESTSVQKTASGLEVKGNLTIKDTEKSITMNLNPVVGVMQDIRGDDQVIFSGSYTLDRTEYGVAGERWSRVKEGIAGVADDIRIEFSILAKQINKDNFQNWVRNEQRPPGRLYKAYNEGGIDQLTTEYAALEKEIDVNAAALNTVGYMLLKSGKLKDALKVMELNEEKFPDNPNVYDSMAEVYAALGKLKDAKKYYEKVLSLDEENVHAKEVLRNLE